MVCWLFFLFLSINAQQQRSSRLEPEAAGGESRRDGEGGDVGGDRELFNWSHCSLITHKVVSVRCPLAHSRWLASWKAVSLRGKRIFLRASHIWTGTLERFLLLNRFDFKRFANINISQCYSNLRVKKLTGLNWIMMGIFYETQCMSWKYIW